MAESARSAAAEPAFIRRRHPSRDAVEGILSAVILVLIIRHFVFEVFKIPTGSMAPTLLGQHRDMTCPNCGLEFPVDAGTNDRGITKVVVALCPNCGHEFPPEVTRNTFCTCFPSWPQRLFWQGGNRVVVNKFLCAFCPPKRWDITVFRYPYHDLRCFSCGARLQNVRDTGGPARCPECGSRFVLTQGKNYIKRLVGLPGEEISIRHGDIYADGRLQRKPPGVQGAAWQFVYDSAYVPKNPTPRFSPIWVETAGRFTADGGILRLMPGAGGEAEVEFRRRIMDFNAYNGWSPDVLPVGDLQWDVRVRLKGPGVLQLRLTEDSETYAASVAFGKAGHKTTLAASGKVVAESSFEADPAKEHRVAFSNVDDRLELSVDGASILTHDYTLNALETGFASGASVGVRYAEAAFSRIRLSRDLYYLPPEKSFSVRYSYSAEVPPGRYYMFGDNTRNSWDSRYWDGVPVNGVIGRAVVLWWPPARLRPIR